MSKLKLTDLPDRCLDIIASKVATAMDSEATETCPKKYSFILLNEHDITRDVIAIACSAKSMYSFATMVMHHADPPSHFERSCRELCDGIDEDDGHEDIGLGGWTAKRGVTVAMLKAVCKTKGLPVSGNKDRLIARLRKAWIKSVSNRDFRVTSGTAGMSKRRIYAAKAAYMRFQCNMSVA